MELKLCDKLPTLIAFTAEWCGHCKNFKPQLELLAKASLGENFEYDDEYAINYHVKNMSESDTYGMHFINQFEIASFPTILVAFPKSDKNHKIVVYNGARTFDSIKPFLVKGYTTSYKDWSHVPKSVQFVSHNEKCKKIP